MIEVLSTSRCTECDICVRVCPTNVFDAVTGHAPVIARQDDCQTCFQCEANCPVDALFVSPFVTPQAGIEEPDLVRRGLLGSYRERIGWGRGRVSGASTAVGPALKPGTLPLIS